MVVGRANCAGPATHRQKMGGGKKTALWGDCHEGQSQETGQECRMGPTVGWE